MATTQHYIWASGHFLLLLTSFIYYWKTATFQTASPFWYKTAFTGALISYAIVCHKSLGMPQPSASYVRRALADENVQYFLLAFMWWSTKPVAIALLPYTIFSLFHALTFTRTTLMPTFLPPGPPTQAGGPPTPNQLARRLQVWVKANYDKAMKVVAYTELLILGRVVIGLVLLQNSLVAPLVYAHFLRARHFQSVFTRGAVGDLRGRIDARVRAPGMPPVLAQGWDFVLSLLGRWAGATLQAQAPEQAQAQAQAPPAGRAR